MNPAPDSQRQSTSDSGGVAARLARAREQLDRRGRVAVTAARERLGAFGAVQRERLRHTVDREREVVRRAGHETALLVQPQRLRDGGLALLATGLHAGGQLLERWARKADKATACDAGETAGPGTLTCLTCGRVIHLAERAAAPPCPECLATRFRKSY